MTWARICAWLIAFEYFLKQNNYFGWNTQPKSEAEVLADGITLFLISFAVFVTVYEPAPKVDITITRGNQ